MLKYKNIILCLASILFYAWGEPKNFILMLISILFNFVVALHIDKCNSAKLKKLLIIFAVSFNLGLLGFYKYSGFITENISLISGTEINFTAPLLPIGISFYTFQILSYVIDVYRCKVEVQKSILNFALYISMFPQLIAGPIVQYSEINNQLNRRNESVERAGEGICLFVKGLAKKTVFANTSGAVFEGLTAVSSASLSMFGAWLAITFYAFQIYFDFSGYSDMAKGLGLIFGFDFPDNFRHPYSAVSVTDFWRRWHITLSSWFRDYVYIPLGGNRCSKFRNIINLLVVWSLTGLWHGASWNFVLWGIYYFILLVIEKYFMLRYLEKLPRMLRRFITFIAVLFGWVLFAFTSMSEMGEFISSLIGMNGIVDSASIFTVSDNLIMLIFMGVLSAGLFSVKFTEADKKNVFKTIIRFIVTVLLFIISVIYLVGDTYNPFLYFRF